MSWSYLAVIEQAKMVVFSLANRDVRNLISKKSLIVGEVVGHTSSLQKRAPQKPFVQ